MDLQEHRFDVLTRSLSGVLPRRAVVRGLLGAGCGLGALRLPDAVAVKPKKKKRKKRKPSPRCDVCRRGCAFTRVQAAIDAAKPGKTIRLCPGTYREHVTVAKNLILRGGGAGRSILDGGGAVGSGSVLSVASGATVEVRALTIRGGNGGEDGEGGGIANQGTLTLDGVHVTANKASDGAGIFNIAGALTLTGSRVSGNEAKFTGGGFYVSGGEVRLEQSHVTANEAGTQGGGLFVPGGAVTLEGTRVTGNSATAGGGIYRESGTVTVEPGSVTGNTPNNCAGQAVSNCVN